MRKLEPILWAVLLWLLATCAYAYYYVVTILALPEEYDNYARNWKFQLLMFSLFRLPLAVLALAVIVSVIIAWPPRRAARRVDSGVI